MEKPYLMTTHNIDLDRMGESIARTWKKPEEPKTTPMDGVVHVQDNPADHHETLRQVIGPDGRKWHWPLSLSDLSSWATIINGLRVKAAAADAIKPDGLEALPPPRRTTRTVAAHAYRNADGDLFTTSDDHLAAVWAGQGRTVFTVEGDEPIEIVTERVIAYVRFVGDMAAEVSLMRGDADLWEKALNTSEVVKVSGTRVVTRPAK